MKTTESLENMLQRSKVGTRLKIDNTGVDLALNGDLDSDTYLLIESLMMAYKPDKPKFAFPRPQFPSVSIKIHVSVETQNFIYGLLIWASIGIYIPYQIVMGIRDRDIRQIELQSQSQCQLKQ